MPKKKDNSEHSNLINTEQQGMTSEEHLNRNEISSSTNQEVPDLTDIEKEEIKDKSDNLYKPELLYNNSDFFKAIKTGMFHFSFFLVLNIA
jgi:hypothetical protein